MASTMFADQKTKKMTAIRPTPMWKAGADKVIEAVENNLKIKAGETTADNQVSLLTARCIGACGIAPAVVYDGAVTPRQTPESTLEQINKWVKK